MLKNNQVTHRPTTLGFTLIEVLIVIAIFLLLTVGAMVTYRTFSRRQQVFQSAKIVQEALRFAQKKARVGEKPAGCQTLQGYSVRGTTNSATLTLYAECSNQDYSVSTMNLIGGGRLRQNITVVFQVISGGVTGTGDIDVGDGQYTYEFTVSRGGEITEGDFE